MLNSTEESVRSIDHNSDVDHNTEELPRRQISKTEVRLPRARRHRKALHYARIFGNLNAFEWLLLLRMSLLLAAFLIIQRRAPLPDLMVRFDAEPIADSPRQISPGRLVYLVTGLVRFTLRDRFCMKRSILIFHFLRKWGYDARILFGVVKSSDGLQGHAWVELNGCPLAERGDPRLRYAVTYSYPTI